MPELFLSPSTQEFNQYYDGSGSEEYYMNLIANAMEPYLVASGITFTRNDPSGTAGDSVRASNAGSYGLHLALHSNASRTATPGGNRARTCINTPPVPKGGRQQSCLPKILRRSTRIPPW